MNWDRVRGNWKQFKGRALEKWATWRDDRVTAIEGRREILAGKLQEAYGIGKEAAERQIDDWQHPIQESANDHDAGPQAVSARR
jgi:uncharacterized protein YjbJ (UPF0337 family)